MSTTTSPSPRLVHDGGSPLEDGTSADSPAGDNIVLDSARVMVQASTALGVAQDQRMLDDAGLGLHLRDSSSASPFGNTAYLTRPIAGGSGELVAALRSFYGAAPGGPYLLFSVWPTGDQTGAGLAPVGHPPLMARFTPARPMERPELQIREATTEADLVDFERTLVEGYPTAELLPYRPLSFFTPAVLDSGWRLLVGVVDGRAVACAAGFAGESATLVEMVATRPEARGRGYGALLTDAVSGDDPARPAVLIASDAGRDVYARLGFRAITRFTLWAGSR
jgi:GNAT superfamily N-acetyltransferase